MTGPKRRWLVLSIATMLGVLVAAGFLLGLSWSREGRIAHPETGFRFPDVAEIERIKVVHYGLGAQHVLDRQVPAAYWTELLDSLTPSEYEPLTRKVEIVGELQITREIGDPVFVAIYYEPEGFTAGGKKWQSRKDYRGGNSAKLKSVLERALANDRRTHDQR
jgi:hypothetical protein